ncbi:MAG: ABC transporter permease [Aestuariivirga sp.]|jgi:iron(III) transport system permease protein|uniref:ABC transporter permease n=1 Tax=Aestuariivirga sp. TaxID=2650926 RepID=UPI0038D0B11A
MSASVTGARFQGPPRTLGDRLLSLAALITGLALAMPVLTIILLALTPTENVWPHLISTVLPGYVLRTLLLMAGVGLITFVVGTAVAWLVTMCRFPLRPLFLWASLLPLAMPGYIVAYAYVDFLSYAGPLQTWLRGVFGWTSPGDYWFPEIRSLGGAVFVLSMVLYPYVFLTARASFIRQPATQLEVARALGRTPWGAFRAVALPLARPGIAVGVSLALMECLNDIGAAGFFGVRTLTLGVYTTWLSQGNLGGAAQISAVMLLFIFLLVWFERTARRKQSFVLPAQRPRQPDRIRLNGWQRVLAVVVCALPVIIGFVAPALILLSFAASRLEDALSVAYLRAVYHSLLLASLAAAAAVALGLVLGYANRAMRKGFTRKVIRLASLGYAIPGTVLGIGVLIPLAGFDNALDSFLRAYFGISTGLLLSGSIAAIIFAYVVRFLAVSFGAIETGLQKVTPNVAAAARTLGRGPISAFFEVHLPLLRPALVSAALLVFVDCMKELPATLILRPFDFETLATSVFLLASLDQLEESALPALTIVAVGLLPVILLSRTLHEPHITS